MFQMKMTHLKLGPSKNHCVSVLRNINEGCLTERQCDLTFLCRQDQTEVHAHTVIMKNVSALISKNLHLLTSQHKIIITLDGVASHTVVNLLKFLYLGKINNKGYSTPQTLLYLLFSGQVVVNEDAAESLHHLCQLLRIDFGKEIVSLPAGAGASKAKRIKRKITSESGSREQKSTKIKNNTIKPLNNVGEKNLEIKSSSLRSKQGLNLSPRRNPHAPGSHTGENKSPVTRKRRFGPQGSLDTVKTEGEAETTSPVTRKRKLCHPASSSKSVVKTEAEAADRRASTSGLIEGAQDTRLYCYCQKPTSKDLIGCDHCPQVSRVPITPSQYQPVPVTQWYHPACLALSAASLEILLRLPSWRCPECQAAISRRAATHRQLQLPIPSSTKFCEVSPGMQ